MPKQIEAIVVSHTHWDREWFKSFEETRFRLLELIQRLVEIYSNESDRSPFWLDGQCVTVEDALGVIEGELRDHFVQLLRDGKVLIGPWYTLSDELLVSGESLVRNLFLGREIMKQYGQSNDIGYLPDTFGHISQMPQILLGFGIDNALFWRGCRSSEIRQVENLWAGSHGEPVVVSHLPFGYNNARGLNKCNLDNAVLGIGRITAALTEKCKSGLLLLMNGCDQTMPSFDIDQAVERLNSEIRDVQFRTGTLHEYFNSIRNTMEGIETNVLHGELLFRPQLDGTLSSRPSQKHLNRDVENLLTFYAEPLAAFTGSDMFCLFLTDAWRLVCKNHAHDSMCGCHSDVVAQDVDSRFHHAIQIGKSICHHATEQLIGCRSDRQQCSEVSSLVFYNPTCWTWNEVMEVEVDLPASSKFQRLTFLQNGKELDTQIISKRLINRPVEGEYSKWTEVEYDIHRYSIVFRPEIPATAFARFEVKTETFGKIDIMEYCEQSMAANCDGRTPLIGSLGGLLDNGLISVCVNDDGSFSITDLKTGETFKHLNKLIDRPDPGDLYESCTAINLNATEPRVGYVTLKHNGPLFATVLVETEIICNCIPCPVQTEIKLTQGSSSVDVKLRFCNQSSQHVLKSIFRLTKPVNLKVHMPFDIVDRQPEENETYWDSERWRSRNSPLQPMHYFLYADSGERSLYVANKGLYEFFYTSDGRIEITLFRSAGSIRDNLSLYKAEDGIEKGQCVIEYRVGLADDLLAAIISAYQFNLPPYSFQTFNDSAPLPDSLVTLSNKKWVLSSIKPAQNRKGVVVRFWNSSDKEETGRITTSLKYNKAFLTHIDESIIDSFDGSISLKPKEIATVLWRMPS